ncbi:MAG: hypothetical protein SFU56_01920 [Capsulimonadales bacterium]|nr:hypothetical protein [Capsulimonadales bacterium]
MAQKSGNNVKPPVSDHGTDPEKDGKRSIRESLTDQHHGENTESLQDDRKIGQHQGAGRPPLMKK